MDLSMPKKNDENWKSTLELLSRSILHVEKSKSEFNSLQKNWCSNIAKMLGNDEEKHRAFYEMSLRNGANNIPIIQELLDLKKIHTSLPTNEQLFTDTSTPPVNEIPSLDLTKNFAIPTQNTYRITTDTENGESIIRREFIVEPSELKENITTNTQNIHLITTNAENGESTIIKENIVKRDRSLLTQRSTKKLSIDEVCAGISAACNIAYAAKKFDINRYTEDALPLLPAAIKRKYDLMEPAFPKHISTDAGKFVVLGSNNTQIRKANFDQISWDSPAAATRALLTITFDDETLSTHSLTGKPSPAFHGEGRPSKKQLDQKKVDDIVQCVMMKCGCKKRDVRYAITSKCADTTKKYKRRSSTFTETAKSLDN